MRLCATEATRLRRRRVEVKQQNEEKYYYFQVDEYFLSSNQTFKNVNDTRNWIKTILNKPGGYVVKYWSVKIEPHSIGRRLTELYSRNCERRRKIFLTFRPVVET